MGAGCALFDFDRDGDLDIYLIAGAGCRLKGDPEFKPRNRLLRQSATGQFEDVSSGSGLDVADLGMGVAVGDINNDGWPDLFLSNYGPDRLFLNSREGKFLEITAEAGVEDLNWGASACFVDYDRDGWLDLCVANYLDYDAGHPCPDAEGVPDYCNPRLFKGRPARLFHNMSGVGLAPGQSVLKARFQDVSWECGIGRVAGPGLGVVAGDFNGDHWPDLYVANDGAASFLWVNQKDGTFVDEAVLRSAAYDNQGRAQAGMGIALGDPDHDGDPDLHITHLKGENNALYLNDPVIGFDENSARAGLAVPSFSFTGFGTAFLDLDLDGDQDLAVVNGAVRRPRLGMLSSASATSGEFRKIYGEFNQIFLNSGTGQFSELPRSGQPFCELLNVGRGLSIGDVDNDGDIDVLTTDAFGAARLFLNEATRQGHWFLVRAIEPASGERDACGAQITVMASGQSWTGWVNPAGSYLSASDPRVHFGLGKTTAITSIIVIWPDGTEEHFAGGPVDRSVTVARGTGASRAKR